VVRLSDRIVVLKDHRKIAELANREGLSADDIVNIIASDGIAAATRAAASEEAVVSVEEVAHDRAE